MSRVVALLAFLIMAGVLTGCVATHRGEGRAAPHYDMQVRLNGPTPGLEVRGTLHLPRNPEARQSIRLSLLSRMTDFAVSASVDGRPVAARLELRERGPVNNLWEVRPDRDFPAGGAIALRFSFRGGGPTGLMFHIGPDVAFASGWGADWYPSLGPGKATASLSVETRPGYRVIAGDRRLSTSEEEALGRFRFAVTQPTYLSFVAGRFAEARAATDARILAYTLEPRPGLDQYLAGVARLTSALEAEFGPLPSQQLVLVEVPRPTAQQAGFNAASLPGYLLLNSNAFRAPSVNYLAEWLGHEISHQWFPHRIAFNTPPGLYMEEALAEYGGIMGTEALLGPAAAERLRRSGFEFDPIYSAQAYFRQVQAGLDVPLSRLEPRPGHRDLAYNKGSLVFFMLADEIGRDRFRRAIRSVLRSGPREHGWTAFLAAIEESSGRELDWFYDQWFDRPGAPDFTLRWRSSGRRVSGEIVQPSPLFRARLELEVAGRDGRRSRRTVQVRALVTRFSFDLDFEPTAVTLDPAYRILRWTPDFRSLPGDRGRS